MLAATLSTALVAISAQAATFQPSPGLDPSTIRLEDVVVDGRPLATVADEFVDSVGESPRGRGLARWYRPVCVGMVNLRRDVAQPLIDHIASVALDLGVRMGDPGCRPNVVVVFTEEPKAVASAVVQTDPRGFRLGPRNFHLSSRFLDEFLTSDAPVRWWHTSVPVDSDTGERAVRLPGDVDVTGNPSAPSITVNAASRLNSQIRDDLARITVIVDVARVTDASPRQLGDYLAFVALAQVDPRGEPSQPSVLNAFDAGPTTDGLSDWDKAYLRGLYKPGALMRVNRSAVASGVAGEVARSIRSARREEQ